MYRWCWLKHKKPVSDTAELVTMREVEKCDDADEPEPVYEECDLDDLKEKPSCSTMPPTTTAITNSTWMNRCRLQQERASNPYSNQQLKPGTLVEEMHELPEQTEGCRHWGGALPR